MIELLKIEGEKSIEIKKKLNETIEYLKLLDAAISEQSTKIEAIMEYQILEGVSDGFKADIARLSLEMSVYREQVEELIKKKVKPEPHIVTYQNPPTEEDGAPEWWPINDGKLYWAHNGFSTSIDQVPPEIIAAWKEANGQE